MSNKDKHTKIAQTKPWKTTNFPVNRKFTIFPKLEHNAQPMNQQSYMIAAINPWSTPRAISLQLVMQ